MVAADAQGNLFSTFQLAKSVAIEDSQELSKPIFLKPEQTSGPN